MTTLYPRTTLKGESPSGHHFPDQPYPHGVRHDAHVHGGCRLRADATVLACKPRPVGAYVLRLVARDCVERDAAWLRRFVAALEELADEESTTSGGAGGK